MVLYSPDNDCCPEHGGCHGDEEAEEEAMVGFTDARVQPRTVMIKPANTSAAVFTVTCS